MTGLVAGFVCAFAVTLKYRLNVDDTLDVVGVHGAGGLVGLIMVGLFATSTVSGKEGLFYGVAAPALEAGRRHPRSGRLSFVLTWILAKVVDAVVGFADKEDYAAVPGQEEERAYDFRTAERLDALAGGGRDLDRETLEEIQRLLRDHRER
ncbi:hypothetical protein NKH77_51455 [Streptomyces sp. M19]